MRSLCAGRLLRVPRRPVSFALGDLFTARSVHSVGPSVSVENTLATVTSLPDLMPVHNTLQGFQMVSAFHSGVKASEVRSPAAPPLLHFEPEHGRPPGHRRRHPQSPSPPFTHQPHQRFLTRPSPPTRTSWSNPKSTRSRSASEPPRAEETAKPPRSWIPSARPF